MGKTSVFQNQITASFGSDVDDNRDLTLANHDLTDDLNSLRTQIRRLLNPEGTWVDNPALDLYEINSMFTGTLNINNFNATGSTTLAGVSAQNLISNKISGSLTKLSDGTDYLIAGSNITLLTTSNGAIQISSTGGGGDNFFVSTTAGAAFTTGSIVFAGNEPGIDSPRDKGTDVFFYVSGSILDGSKAVFGGDVRISGSLALGQASSYIRVENESGTIVFSPHPERISVGSDTFFFVSGSPGDGYKSVFSGDVVVSGSIKTELGFSGSLTKLADGTSYLVAGNNITITSASNGSITITSTAVSSPGGLNTQIQFNDEGSFGGSEGLTYDKTSSTLSTISGSFYDITISNDAIVQGGLEVRDNITANGSNNQFNNLSITGSSGLSVINDVIIGGDVAISGDLIVDGTTTTINTTNLEIKDSIIGLGFSSGTIAETSGDRGWIGGLSGGENVAAFWDDSAGEFAFATTTNSATGSLPIPISSYADLRAADISGNVVKANLGFSGSLTQLTDGTSYLVAGSGIQITSQSNGSIIISSTGDDGAGGSSGTIGDPEDGTYTDGIFTDFTPSTPIGTAIDRFNELLLSLAPAPAPDLDNLDCDASAGTTAYLSFGSSNDQSLASPAYISSNTTAGFSAIDVNGSYSASTSGNNIRKGIYTGTTNISGDLNEDVSSYVHNTGVTNYVANAFGNANQGTLKLYVNGSLIHSVDLTTSSAGIGVPGSGTKSQLNANGSGFTNLSQTGSALQSNGMEFSPFQHRTGKYLVHTSDQRNGWNYLQVIHDKGSTQTQTNYVEWVNDSNADALSASNSSLSFVGSGSIHLSGVEYFQSGTLTYKVKVDNAYKYVYDTTAISFTTSNSSAASSGLSFSLSNQAKPTINTSAGENHTKSLHITSSAAINADYLTSGSITVGVNVTHPLKSNLSNSGQATTSQVLTYNYSNTSTELVETFRRENYRIVSGSYDAQADVINASNVWNSQVFMTSSNGGHSDGLQFYNATLVSPKNTTNGGNFSVFSGGPNENPNYSGITGTRTFYRWFKNASGAQYDLSLAMNGSSTIVSNATAFNTSRIKCFIKIPGKTGWMDVALPFVLDNVQEGAGAYVSNALLSFDSTLNATNYLNFGNVSVDNNEYVVLKILADSSWTGNVSSITVDFGAGTGTLTPVPDLDNIDSDNTGTTARLSFGSSKSITGYTNSSTDAGFSAADLNAVYQVATSGANLRRAVFTGATTMEGDLNEDVTSPGQDYVANAFSDANSGSISLEVNGSVIHAVELTGSYNLVGVGSPGAGTGTSLNANGSGFIALSTWGPGLFDNGVPRYSEIQRTARYRVVPANQRTGWNYLRVYHTVNGVDRTTNYVEWVNDPDSNALSSAGNGLSIFGDDSFSYMSGVKFFNSPSGSIRTRISNIYKNVYSNSSTAISFASLTNATAAQIIQSGSGLSSTKTTNATTDSLQTLNTNLDSQNELLHVSGTINFTRTKSLPGNYTTAYSCGGAMVFLHPLKSTLTLSSQLTTNMLVWTPVNTSNANTDEYFTSETYRLTSGSYTAQSDITGGTKTWDSTISMDDQVGNPTYATGLLVYDTYLLAPKDGGVDGDFRNHIEGGSIESPAGNVNYSSLTNSTRNYFRGFLNNTVNDRPSVQVTLFGDAKIVGKTGANAAVLGANKNVFVEVGIPGKTGLLDLGKPSAGSGNFNEGDGCLSGDLNSTVTVSGVTNTCTFNGRTADGTVSGAEYIVVKISASEDWTGYLDRISITWS